MRPFDPKSYLGDVLAPHLGSAEPPSLFDRYLLDLDDGDEAAIAARLEEVKRYWDKKTEHARYGQLVRQLIDGHAEARLTLGDPAERSRAVERARSERRESEQRSQREIAEWEQLLGQIVESAGGLDPARRAQLEKMAARIGIPAEEAARRLDAAPVAAEPEVLSASQRTTISRALTALARDLGEPRVGLSLYHAFGLDLGEEAAAVAARREEEMAENRRRAHGNAKANWDAVLSLAKVHLLDEDPRAYVNGLVLDVREALAEAAMRAVADDGAIDEVEAEHLRSQALALGLTPELAQQAIAELARESGAVVRTGATVDVVACPSCNHPHPRPQNDRHCRLCGSPLFVTCPSCGTSCDATAGRCSSCATDLHRHAAAMRALGRLPALLDAGNVRQAGDDLAAALEVLGRCPPGHEEIARRVTVATEAAKRGWAEVEAARDERRQYAAKRALTELAGTAADFPGPSGEIPAEALRAAAARVEEAEAMLRRAQGLSGAERERALIEVLRTAADCAEAERELDELPPAPPASVEAEPSGAGMTVRWQASPTGGVRYEVTRLAAGARSRVGETESAQIEDTRAAAGALVRYSVHAVRGRARSAPVESELVAAAYEVSGLAAHPGDGEVRLAWAPHPAGRVLATRREEGGEEVALAAESTGLLDGDVVNGRHYTYSVRVEYPGEGGAVTRTPGLTAFAQPAERPQPVPALALQAVGDSVRLEFEQPAAGTASVFRCAEDPEAEPGEEIEPRRLAELGQPLPALSTGAVDREPPSGRCFYLAVTVSGGVAVAGATATHVALPEIENVQAVANGSRALLTWSWPEGIALARVVWRHDRQPAGPEDPDAAAADFRLGEYRDRGGFTIDLGSERSLFAHVYPARRLGAEVVYGSGGGRGSRATLRSEEKTALRYSVKRAGRLQKRLEISVSEPAEGALPELVLVGREGDILPRSAGEGTVLARLGGDGPRSSSLELRGLSRPLAVRLFLDSASASSAFVLHDPMADELLIA